MRLILCIFIVFIFSCKQDIPVPNPPSTSFKTKNVFIVVMDGARYSETWGEPNKIYIPNIKALSSQGVMCTGFYNDGETVTVPGHTAMTTGYFQVINNAGQEIPEHPSIFQYYRSQFSKPATDAWVISTKDKLEVLSDCTDPEWAGTFRPRTDCGVNGNHTGYREDSTTYRHLVDTITKYHPHLVLVNFKQPDAAGHANSWVDYINGTKKIDQYVADLWNFLQGDSLYAGTTTLFVTNDHGRHLQGVYDGFVSHWCGCDGCRHIFLLGLGPDFKTNYIETGHYSLIDIPSTVSELIGIKMPNTEGKVMTTILK
jgi:predicted AlkP superfamily pyrophosphatase or phosphodiesterase